MWTREALLARHPCPETVYSPVKGKDGEGDYDALYAIGREVQPALVVELGTRDGTSARILAASCPGARLVCIDPEECAPPAGAEFIKAQGEHVFWTWDKGLIDLLFIDTDPHSYEQTLMWLETYVARLLRREGGVACFHDTLTSDVGKAIHDWIKDLPGWEYVEMGTGHGMGVLRFMGGRT